MEAARMLTAVTVEAGRDGGGGQVQHPANQTQTGNGRADGQRKRNKKSEVRPPLGVTKEVVVVGDGNVGLVAQSLVERVGATNSVEVLYNKGATVADARRLMQEYEQAARALPRMWILHVGLTDLLRAKEEEVVRQLEKLSENRERPLIICAIPEVTQRGGETRARIVLTNAQLKRMCKQRRIRFADTTVNGFANDFTVDGVSYNEEGIRKVVEKLTTPITRFLGWECVTPFRGAPESATRTKTHRKATDENTPQGDAWSPTEGSGRTLAPDRRVAGHRCVAPKLNHEPDARERKYVEPRLQQLGEVAKMPYGEWNGAPRFPEMKGLEALFQEWMREQLIRSWPRLGSANGQTPWALP